MKNRTKEELISRIYYNQRKSSRERKHPLPTYTHQELYDWVMITNKTKFNRLYEEWINSNYERDFIPSIDRVNSKLPYTLNNIQLLKWEENRLKGNLETVLKHIKTVEQYTLQGEFVKEWYSMSRAAKAIKITRGLIKRCADGNKLSAGGYQWRYKDSDKVIKDISSVIELFSFSANPIFKMDLEGNVLKQYNSFTEASKDIGNKGKRTGAIRACCEYKSKYFMNFKWRYVDAELNNKFKEQYEKELLSKVKIIPEKKLRIFKHILQFTKEEIFVNEFESAIKAAEYINKPVRQLRKRLDGDRSGSYCGFIWKYK